MHASRTQPPEGAAFDLHALGTPPAFILSQDQTLRLCLKLGIADHHSRFREPTSYLS
jgi:hypothetical protein